VSVPGGGAGGQSPDDHRYVDMMSLQLPSSLELGSSLRGALPSDLDLNAADQQVSSVLRMPYWHLISPGAPRTSSPQVFTKLCAP